jgi:WhiB family redox-sensing transcriptional regulator
MAAMTAVRLGTSERHRRVSGDTGGHWRLRAACRDMPAELFFPSNGPLAEAQVLAAKAICDGCPVTAQCLDFALATRQEFGIWGGKDAIQRRRLVTAQRLF